MIEDAMFGARYVGLRNFDRFDDAISQTNIGEVVWPGGSLAERNSELYGFEHDNLFVDNGKPGLTEMMAYCVERDLALTVVLPTARYEDSPELLHGHLQGFLSDLGAGFFGELPTSLHLEIGNEFYANFSSATEMSKAVDYARVVNEYARTIEGYEHEFGPLPSSVSWGVQLGREASATEAMLDALSDDAILLTDYVIHHRFTTTYNGISKSVDALEGSLEAWADHADDLGVASPTLAISAYNTASLSRMEAAQDYLLSPAGQDLALDDLDLDGRSNEAFESFFEARLSARPAGMEHAKHLLSMFTAYADLGATQAATYGWDLTHSSSFSYEDIHGNSHIFAAGALQDMMAESILGTEVSKPLLSDLDAGQEFSFFSENKLVLFLCAPSDGTTSAAVDLSGFSNPQGVWAMRLTDAIPEDWQSLYGIPKTSWSQIEEGKGYADAVREVVTPEVNGSTISITFSEPDEIVRLSIALSDEGYDDIAEWHEGSATAIEVSEYSAKELLLDDAPKALSDDTPDEQEDFFGDTLVAILASTLMVVALIA